MAIYPINARLSLLELELPASGYGSFLGTYLYRGDKQALVDVGPTSAIPSLFRALKQLNVSPAEIDYVILTHIHIDHAGGIGTALREIPNATVIAHPRARRHLVDPTQLWNASLKTLGELAVIYDKIEPVPTDRIVDATDGMILDLGNGLELALYLTPGHAPHHLSIFEATSGVLLAGEVAGVCFDGSARPATPPPFKMEEMLSSLDKVIALRPSKICYGHFGCFDNGTERLRLYREKLITWSKIAKAETMAGKSPEEILQVLKQTDKDLASLDTLNANEYKREYLLLTNAIRGLAEGG